MAGLAVAQQAVDADCIVSPAGSSGEPRSCVCYDSSADKHFQDDDCGNDFDVGTDYYIGDLESDPANCSAGNYPLGIDADGAVQSCTADDDVPEAGDFGALALTGDVTSVGLATTVAANAVALTTDTTGNYAAGDAEAGAALTGDSATAFFSSGTIEDARLPATLVDGPGSSTDNALVRWDGTSGTLIQDYTSGAPTVTDTGAATFPVTIQTPYVKVGPDNLTTFLNIKWDSTDVRYEAITDTSADYPWALGIENRRDMEFNNLSNKVIFYSAFNADVGGSYAGTVNFSSSALLRMDNTSTLQFNSGSVMDADSGAIIGGDLGSSFRIGVSAAITANGLDDQSTATVMTCQMCVVTTVTALANSVKMDDCSGTYKGAWKYIANADAADNLKVFPDTNGNVGSGTNSLITLVPTEALVCVCSDTDIWYCWNLGSRVTT